MPRLYKPSSLQECLAALASDGDAAPLAGATWIMRASSRGEQARRTYVAVNGLKELTSVQVRDKSVSIGAAVTHEQLAAVLTDLPELQVLAQAAAHSANPAVRAVATIGGNLCAHSFHAADLVPALLSLDAEVVVARQTGTDQLSLGRFLQIRANLEPGTIVTNVIVPRRMALSAHARLPLRAAGDYPVAIISVCMSTDIGGVVTQARVAIGSVEQVARRWSELECVLVGCRLNPNMFARYADELRDSLNGRDGTEAPGWYRVKVVPTLVRRAIGQACKTVAT